MRKLISLLGFSLIAVLSLQAKAIIDGNVVNGNASPETVYLGTTEYGGLRSCTGVVVAPHLILTAGHCLEEMGSLDQLQISNMRALPAYMRSITVAKAEAHPKYRSISKGQKESQDIQYDIAYIMTKENLQTLLRNMQFPIVPATLDDIWTAINQKNLWAYGYGLTKPVAPTLKTINTNKVEMAVEMVGTSVDHYFVTKSSKSGVSQCQGDSGSGLFARTAQGDNLVGILSGLASVSGSMHQIKDCGKDFVRAAYVPLDQHLCWILQATGVQLAKNLTCP